MSNRIYISKSGDGYMNLAVDEYILQKYHNGELTGVTLYFYVNDNAVIIGRNQNAWRECDLERMEKEGVQLVRRHTGGGAVYHDKGNLNFSFITDEKQYDKARQTAVIVKACEKLGIKADISGRNDILADGRKFSGNAYAVWGRARGQHGTLLVDTELSKLGSYLSVSKEKLAAKGIASVASRVCNITELVDTNVQDVRGAVIDCFLDEYGEAEDLEFDQLDNESINRIYNKMSSWEWRLGRAPKFDLKLEHRFSFGELQLMLTMKHGIVDKAEVYTDALDTRVSQEIVSLIMGSRLDKLELVSRLIKGSEYAKEIAGYIESEGLQ